MESLVGKIFESSNYYAPFWRVVKETEKTVVLECLHEDRTYKFDESLGLFANEYRAGESKKIHMRRKKKVAADGKPMIKDSRSEFTLWTGEPSVSYTKYAFL